MSTFNLYLNTENKKWELTQDKNFRVENFSQYLLQFESVFYEKGQYFKNQLYCELKVEKEQLNIQPKYYNAIKYVRVNDYQTNTSYYYFVEKISWRSSSTISLSLKMDTLNTFAPYIDYQFSNKTKINRQHKARFSKFNICHCSTPYNIVGEFVQKRVPATFTHFGNTFEGLLTSWVDTSESTPQFYFTIINHEFQVYIENISSSAPMQINGDGFSFTTSFIGCVNKLIRKIDYIDEEISPVLYKEDNHLIINREGVLNQDWYLVYRSSDNEATSEELNAVDCFLVPENPTTVIQPNIQTTTLSVEDWNFGDNSVYIPQWVPYPPATTTYPYTNINQLLHLTLYTSDGIKEIVLLDDSTYKYQIIQIKKEGNKLLVFGRLIYPTGSGNTDIGYFSYLCDKIVFGDRYYYGVSDIDFHEMYNDEPHYYGVRPAISIDETSSQIGTTNTTILSPLSELDRTDSKLIKIIKIPYILEDFEIEEGKIKLNDKWFVKLMSTQTTNLSFNALYLKDLNTKFKSTFDIEHNFLKVMNVDYESYNSTYRNDENESKIYHSSFYQEKFVYDSFGFTFSLERVNIREVFDKSFEDTMSIDYVMTSTINSKFLFSFTSYVTNELGAVDYEKVLPIARNNEIVLYNNSYITYIRNGFNYDVKTKTRDDTIAWLSFGLSTIGSIISFASSTFTGGIGIAGGISLATSSTLSLVNAVGGTMQREQNLEAKQQQLKAQAGNVYGSDDVDLMSYYAENRAKWVTYQVSPIMKKALLDMFYFLGYRDNVVGIPDISTRTRFNFIACDVILENCVNLSDEIVNDIKKLYSGGVTFIHYYENEWDIKQIFENKERNLDYLI